MKIVCLGGGPAGVYLAISMKLRNSDHDITVYERNKPEDTFGWGVVFSDQTMDNLRLNDPVSAQTIMDELVHWDYIDVHLADQVERSGGHGFIGIGRRRMLEILYQRARQLGVELVSMGPDPPPLGFFKEKCKGIIEALMGAKPNKFVGTQVDITGKAF